MIIKRKYFPLLLLTLLGCIYSSSVFSAEDQNADSTMLATLPKSHFTLELGRYGGTQGQAQHINLQDLMGDTFTVNSHHDQHTLIGAGYFLDGKNLGDFTMSYGVNAFYLAPTSVSGNVIQENLFNNLSYGYDIASVPVYAMAKSTIHLKSPYALTFDIGVGPNFMRTSRFNEASLDGGITLPDDLFSSHTTTTLSATIGASIKINHAIGQLPLEIGYRFFYLGQGHFKNNNDQILSTFKTGKVYANALFLSITL